MQVSKTMTHIQMHHILLSANDFNIKIACPNCSFRSKRFIFVFYTFRYCRFLCTYIHMCARIDSFISICINLQCLRFSVLCFCSATCYVHITTIHINMYIHTSHIIRSVGCNILRQIEAVLITLNDYFKFNGNCFVKTL